MTLDIHPRQLPLRRQSTPPSTTTPYDGVVSDAAYHDDPVPQGTSQLPADLTEAQLAAAPTLASVDALLIEELTDDEDDAFAAAISG